MPHPIDDRVANVLSLAEELLLLAIDDDSNRVPTAQSFKLDFGLAGAVLLDLLLTNRLRVVAGKVEVADASPTRNAVLDDALESIAEATKPRDAQHWVNRLAGDHLRDRVIDALEQRQIVRREEHRVLWIFPADRFPTQDPAPEQAVRARLRAALLDAQAPGPRDTALVALLKACDLLGGVLSNEEHRHATERINDLARPEVVGKAVAQSIEAAEVATAAAVIASTSASTASCSAASTAACQ